MPVSMTSIFTTPLVPPLSPLMLLPPLAHRIISGILAVETESSNGGDILCNARKADSVRGLAAGMTLATSAAKFSSSECSSFSSMMVY